MSEPTSDQEHKPNCRWPRPVVWLLAGAGTVVALGLAFIIGGWILLWVTSSRQSWLEVTVERLVVIASERPLAAAAAGWVFFVTNRADPFDVEPFDREVWLAMHNYELRDNQRGPMANDLRQKLLAERMTQEQVRELLGPTDWHEERGLLMYTLGMWSGHGIHYDSLDIHFDDEGRVLSVDIHRH